MSVIKLPLGSSCNYVSFNGELNCDFKAPALKWAIPHKCEMVERIRVTQTDVNGVILPGLRPLVTSADANSHPETVTIPYLNKNPHTAFYTGANCSIGSNKINDDDHVQCGDTLFKTCIRSKDDEQTMEPTSKIIPLSIEQAYTASAVNANTTKFQSMLPDFDTASLAITPRQVYQWKICMD